MPKETVHRGRIMVEEQHEDVDGIRGAITVREWFPADPRDLLNPSTEIHEEPSLDVRWARDLGEVQIAFDAPVKWWDGFAEALAGSPGEHRFTAWTGLLTRSEINHFIRTLRRARDAAFGSDE